MTTMLEKVALKLGEEISSSLAQNGRWDSFALARAALQAIKEPDDGMEEAGFTALKAEQNAATPGGTCAVVFTAMIDAILNEKPEAPTT